MVIVAGNSGAAAAPAARPISRRACPLLAPVAPPARAHRPRPDRARSRRSSEGRQPTSTSSIAADPLSTESPAGPLASRPAAGPRTHRPPRFTQRQTPRRVPDRARCFPSPIRSPERLPPGRRVRPRRRRELLCYRRSVRCPGSTDSLDHDRLPTEGAEPPGFAPTSAAPGPRRDRGRTPRRRPGSMRPPMADGRGISLSSPCGPNSSARPPHPSPGSYDKAAARPGPWRAPSDPGTLACASFVYV